MRREAQAAAALAHPAICVIYEIDEADDATFIAMELVRGEPLSALVPGGMSAARAVDLAIEMAEGLAEAHARGIVHRDLKPSNVMIDGVGPRQDHRLRAGQALEASGEPGQRHGDAGGRTDRSGRIIGTAAYMSPEQVRGATVDPRSDVFSFGAVLFEMLSGVCAFRRETGVETLHAVLKEPAPRLVGLGLGPATGDVQRVLDLCLAKEPAARYPKVAELVADLRAVRAKLEKGDVQPAAAVAPAPGVSQMLRVLIVDDEEPARAILAEYLGQEPGIEIVGQCRNGFEAVKAVAQLHPTSCSWTCRCRSWPGSRCWN